MTGPSPLLFQCVFYDINYLLAIWPAHLHFCFSVYSMISITFLLYDRPISTFVSVCILWYQLPSYYMTGPSPLLFQCVFYDINYLLTIWPAHLHFCFSVYSVISITFLLYDRPISTFVSVCILWYQLSLFFSWFLSMVSYLVALGPTFSFPLLFGRFSVCHLFI